MAQCSARDLRRYCTYYTTSISSSWTSPCPASPLLIGSSSMVLKLDSYLKIALSLLAFLLGTYLKTHSRPSPLPCRPLDANLRGETITESIQLNDLPTYCCPRQELKYTVHRNTGNPLTQRVFNYSPNPTSPVGSELLISLDLDWNVRDAVGSKCASIYMQRSPTRTDQEHKCIAFAHLPEKEASSYAIGHRNGTIAWPQHLTHQYQEDWVRVDGFPEEKQFIQPILEHIEELLTAFRQEFGPSTDDLGNTRTAIVMVILNPRLVVGTYLC